MCVEICNGAGTGICNDTPLTCSSDNKKNTFFFKTKNCSNDDPFISCNDWIEKMLHNICISAVAVSLR